MGRPKPLLRVHGETFIRRILSTLRDGGAAEAVVVVRPGATDLEQEIAGARFGRAVVNPDPDRGQLSSLIVGLDAVDTQDVSAVLVTLVDVPLVSADTVAALLRRARTTHAPIVRAVHQGRHGHPVIFTRAVFDALRRADPATGAKPVLRDYPPEDVEVGDAGVAEDIDTPGDYARLIPS
jgi:molybdenum cofactor cytidylyltransferase